MSQQTANIDVKGALGVFKKSKRPLAPVYELIVNALEAVAEKQTVASTNPKISVRFRFALLLDGSKEFQSVEVIDDGVGFDDLNFNRFATLLDKSKGYNNRGSGRMQFLHRFNDILVESAFMRAGVFFKRSFSCSPTRFVHDVKTKEMTAVPATQGTGSKISLSEPAMKRPEKRFYDTLTLDFVKQDLRNNLMLWFYLDDRSAHPIAPTLSIEFYIDDLIAGIETLEAIDMPKPVKADKIAIPYLMATQDEEGDFIWTETDKKEELKWAHFRLPESDLSQNQIWLCSKNVPVEQVYFAALRKNLSLEGSRYLTVFYGDMLDDDKNVSNEVDSFIFPKKKDVEKEPTGDMFARDGEELIVRDEVDQRVANSLPGIYDNVVAAREEVAKDVSDIAAAHGIPTEIAQQVEAQIGDNEKRITEKLYRKQAERLATNNLEIKKIYDDLVSLNPTDENYQEELLDRSSELLSRIPQQNMEELSRYVIRREMVAKILALILTQSLEYQKKETKPGERRDKEGLIHDLIFRRKEAANTGLNDLWVLSEEFVHYEGCSDLPLHQIKRGDGQLLLKDIPADEIADLKLKPTRRPDIFLFPDEGKCVVIELKAPDEDLSDHLGQMVKYCNLIANYSTVRAERFYCFLIGENLSPMDLPGDYVATVNDDWVKIDTPIRSKNPSDGGKIIGHIHTEVLLLSSVLQRAHRRNKSFAERLGVRV